MKKSVRQITLPAGMSCDWEAGKRIVRFPKSQPVHGEQALAWLEASAGPVKGAPIFAEIDNLTDFQTLVDSGWQGGVRLQVAESALGGLHSNRTLLRRPRTEIVLADEVSDPGRTLVALAALKLPVFLPAGLFFNLHEEALLKLVEKILFSPFLAMPVHPFLTLLQVLTSGQATQAPTFWDMFRESAGKDYYLEEGGRITLGSRWAERGLYMGELADTAELLQHSEVFTAQADLGIAAFSEGSACSVCPEFFLCRCYLRAIDPDFDCGPVLAMVQALRDVVPDLKSASQATRPPAEEVQAKPATVFVSNDCPNDCLFCAPAENRKQCGAPDHLKILAFIRKCATQGVTALSFSGAGEPTLNPRLTEYISLATELGLSSILFTNGHALDQGLLDGVIAAGLKEIMVSLHGYGATHDQAVGRPGSFQEVERAMELVARTPLRLYANTCLLRSNLGQMDAMLEFTRRFGCTKHSVCFPEWDGSALHHKDALPSYEEVKAVLDTLSGKDYPHLILDNIPACLVPDGMALVNNRGPVMYRDLSEEKISRADFNHGHNTFVRHCKDLQCSLMAKCCGLDKNYLKDNSFPADSE